MVKWVVQVIFISVGVAAIASAAGLGNRAPPPVIQSTSVDFNENIMVISGQNFGSVSPIVRLANQVLEVKSHSGDQITVNLPVGIEPATYRLTVSVSKPYRLTSDVFSAGLFGAGR